MRHVLFWGFPLRLITAFFTVFVLSVAWVQALADEKNTGPEFALERSTPENPRATFVVRHLDASVLAALSREPNALREAFRVRSRPSGNTDKSSNVDEIPPLLGTYEVDSPNGLIRFHSRFKEEPGMTYRASYRANGAKTPPAFRDFVIPQLEEKAPTTIVNRVSPAKDVLPENLLKIYIEFSSPMSFGEAYEHVRLLDAKGKPLDLPFLELGEELWDPRGMRFTLLFDPGRIKNGLKPREELGPVLEAGKSYTFVIDPGWKDATGLPLKAGYRKTFRVGLPDTTPPDPANWRLQAPTLSTTGPLAITFPESLDRALLGRVIVVVDDMNRPVAGKIAIGDDETSWSFTPRAPWHRGGFFVLVDQTLEDLAGNSIGRPFEVDVFKVDTTKKIETTRLKFEPISGSSR